MHKKIKSKCIYILYSYPVLISLNELYGHIEIHSRLSAGLVEAGSSSIGQISAARVPLSQ